MQQVCLGSAVPGGMSNLHLGTACCTVVARHVVCKGKERDKSRSNQEYRLKLEEDCL